MRRIDPILPLLFAFFVSLGSASADPPKMSQTQLDQLGRLCHTELSVHFVDAPANEVLKSIARATGVTIVPISGTNANGFDLKTRVTFSADHVTGLDVLELLLDRAEDYAPLSWQVRSAWIDVGTLEQLARNRETRIYDVEELLHEAPYFGNDPYPCTEPPECAGLTICQCARVQLNLHPYGSASVIHEGANRMHAMPADLCRRSATQEQNELARALVETVSPWNWDWRREDEAGSDVDRRRIALIRFQGRRLVIKAPDFMHRQIEGLLPSPQPQITRSLAELGRDASSEWATVAVHGTTREVTALPSRQVLIDQLLNTVITCRFEGIGARDAFERIAQGTGLPILGRYLDDRLGYGIDPDLPVVWVADEMPALQVIEGILDQCSADEPCTWQARLGYIEVGTKARLNVPSARELRRYDVADLMFSVPDFARGELDCNKRRVPLIGGLDLVETVVTNVEPGIWDFGQIADDEDPIEVDHKLLPGPDGQPALSPAARREARRKARSVRPTYREPPAVASIRLWRKQLLIYAPGYVHRQVGGSSSPGGG